MIRQLLGHGRPKAELVGERVLDDGQLFLRYRIEQLAFERTVALSPLEAATLRYALHRAGVGELSHEDRQRVVDSLQHLGQDIPV